VSNLKTAAALLLVVSALYAAGCSSDGGRPPVVAPPRTPGPGAAAATALPRPGRATLSALVVRVRVADARGARVVPIPIDDYVAGTLRGELAPSTLRNPALAGVLDVQAIVARTYALSNLDRHQAEGFDVCDSTHCQVYRGGRPSDGEADPAMLAAARTRGQVLTFEGRVIQALFHADCGGHTAASDLVWGGPPVPYLRAVPDWFCARDARPPWAFEIAASALRDALGADARTALGRHLDSIEVSRRDASGRAALVTLDGERHVTLRAEELRVAILRAFGPRSLYSTRFTVAPIDGGFRFTGTGNGHGVGLCQAGAGLRVKGGLLPAAILAHYYPGTRLEIVESLATVISPRLAPPLR
jgi:stage II sporulation protein D